MHLKGHAGRALRALAPDKTADGPSGWPRDAHSPATLDPVTPYRETQLGDTAEAHDEISPHDLPVDHRGRKAAERDAAKTNGLTRGDVRD